MVWTNEELREQFAEIASLLRLKGADQFRVRAYERAADAIAAARADLSTLDRGALAALPGVGKSTVEKILEYRERGTIRMLEQLRAEIPPGLIELTRVPGLDLRRVRHDMSTSPICPILYHRSVMQGFSVAWTVLW
jgi:DNA polymerase (family X)